MKKMIKNKIEYMKHLSVYLVSFILNYLIFILFMLFINLDNAIAINLINLVAWIISMLFIFYIDKKYLPNLVNENNNYELFKFILIRLLSLIIETLIIYIFIIILKNNYYLVKLISLVLLFGFNSFYERHIKIV